MNVLTWAGGGQISSRQARQKKNGGAFLPSTPADKSLSLAIVYLPMDNRGQ